MRIRIFFFSFFIIFFPFKNSNAQEVIRLVNPSFEWMTSPRWTPIGWMDLGTRMFPWESPPSIHSSETDFFGVRKHAIHGKSFLGMVVRERESWESVAQNLVKPIIANQCYLFRIKLCQSLTMKSGIPQGNKVIEKEFTTPIVLRIWGGVDGDERRELLGVSPAVDNHLWKEYTFKLQPKDTHQVLVLEAYRAIDNGRFPNGNILLDDASSLVPIDCEMEQNIMKQFYWKPYEITLENIKSKDDLEWYVLHQSFFIGFDSNNILWNSARGNFKEMGKAMRQIPDKKMQIAIDGTSKNRIKKRIKSLKRNLKKVNFPSEQLEIISIDEELKKEEWLLQKNGFFIKILSTTRKN